MKNIVKILDIQQVTHDVKCFRVEKPGHYIFTPGQATDVAINKAGMEKEARPFTFTGLREDPYLEFTIKRYQDHHGVTDQLHQLSPGDELIIDNAWGAIKYEGPGYFIAGGAGITPFISILRMLHKENSAANNRLFFSNKTIADIIYQEELSALLHNEAIFVLSRENHPGYTFGRINKEFIDKHVTDFSRCFYVCGPDIMVQETVELLKKKGATAETVVFEK